MTDPLDLAREAEELLARDDEADDYDFVNMCARLVDALREVVKERDGLAEVRQRGCECGDDEACAFVLERDAARAELAEIRTQRDRLLMDTSSARAELARVKAELFGLRANVSIGLDRTLQVAEACDDGAGGTPGERLRQMARLFRAALEEKP